MQQLAATNNGAGEDKILRVCMFCYPGTSALALLPEPMRASYSISHGLCATHKQSMLAEVRALKYNSRF